MTKFSAVLNTPFGLRFFVLIIMDIISTLTTEYYSTSKNSFFVVKCICLKLFYTKQHFYVVVRLDENPNYQYWAKNAQLGL